jgi:hypothetical protein
MSNLNWWIEAEIPRLRRYGLALTRSRAEERRLWVQETDLR